MSDEPRPDNPAHLTFRFARSLSLCNRETPPPDRAKAAKALIGGPPRAFSSAGARTCYCNRAEGGRLSLDACDTGNPALSRFEEYVPFHRRRSR